MGRRRSDDEEHHHKRCSSRPSSPKPQRSHNTTLTLPPPNPHRQQQQQQQQRALWAALGAAALAAAAAAALASGGSADAAKSFLVNGPLGRSGILPSFSLVFLSEIGDKTFFLTALLALRLGRCARWSVLSCRGWGCEIVVLEWNTGTVLSSTRRPMQQL